MDNYQDRLDEINDEEPSIKEVVVFCSIVIFICVTIVGAGIAQFLVDSGKCTVDITPRSLLDCKQK